MSNCYHCNAIIEELVEFDSKSFCCQGCQTVYELLNQHNLGDYYTIDSEVGPLRPKVDTKHYEYLDISEFRDKVIGFEEGTLAKVKFFLPQIHCSSCLWLLERLTKINTGVIQSLVNFGDKTIEISFDNSKLKLSELANLLATIGYAPDISFDEKKKQSSKKYANSLTRKIGVAGFCFGNIMLLSFPEYLGLETSEGNYQLVFSGLNFLLSLPVLFYCSSDYLVSAFRSVKQRHINIDVPISLGIIAFYLQSIYEIFSFQGTGYLDSFAGLIFFLLIGKWFQQTTYGAINFERDYKSYFPIAVSKIVDELEYTIALKDVNEKDELMIRNNELIPADSILTKGNGNIDYSFVSGESSLISKREGDRLFAGGRQMGQAIRVKVTKNIEDSYLTQLWNNPVFDKEKINHSFTERITKYFTWAIIMISLGAAISWYFIDSSKSIFTLVSVLIIACPCAIALSVPFTYGNGIRVLSKQSFYLRSTSVIENISTISDIIFDKTGTLTLSNKAQLAWHGQQLTTLLKSSIAAVANQSNHPLSRQIVGFLDSHQPFKTVHNYKEFLGKGICSDCDNITIRLGSAAYLEVPSQTNGTAVYVVVDDKYLGYFKFNNVLRPGISQLFERLGKNYKLHVLSGDDDGELENLKFIFPAGGELRFNQQPDQKLNYICDLQKKGAKVMMLGDGLNDAGALKQAEVGVSIVDDVYSFSPASDAIVPGEKIIELDRVIQYCQFNKRVVKLSYAFSIFYNLIGLSFALSGTLTPLVAAILMPISSISVVVLVTVMTSIHGKKVF